jgi:hypothetical protein
MLSRVLGFTLMLSVLMACSSTPVGPASQGGAPLPPASEAVAAVTPQPPAGAAPIDTTPLPSPFVVVGDVPLELWVLQDGRMVGHAVYVEFEDSKNAVHKVFVLDGDRFERVHTFPGPVFGGPHVDNVVSGPDGAIDLLVEHPQGRTSSTDIITAVGPRIKQPPKVHGNWSGVTTWGKTSLAVVYGMIFNQIVALRGPDPGLVRALDTDDCGGNGKDQAKVWAVTLHATEDALFAAGSACGMTPAVEVWKRGAKTSTVFLEEDPNAEVVRRGSDIHIAGKAPKRWNGTTFEPVASVPPEPPFRTSDGRSWTILPSPVDHSKPLLYAVDGDRLREVTLPGPSPQVLVQGGTIWVSTHDGKLHRLDDRKPPPTISLSDRAVGWPDKTSRPRFTAGGPTCKNNVVVLYGFTKVTPDDYDFPLTRKALKGRTEFASVKFAVTRDGGQKFFVGLTPSFDLGKKLRDRIEKEVQGSKPQVVCAEPEIIRELPLDLATGELRK